MARVVKNKLSMSVLLFFGGLAIVGSLFIFSHFQKIQLLFALWDRGDRWPFALTIAISVMAALCLAATKELLDNTFDIEQARIKTEGNAALAADKSQEKNLRHAAEIKLDRLARELEAQGAAVSRLTLQNENNLILATQNAVHAGLETKDIRAYVLDAYGREQIFIVFHFFRDTAYWQYDSDVLFEDRHGRAFDFLSYISRAEFVEEMRTYDFLIGVGLASHTPNPISKIADSRAAFLCGALYGKTLRGKQPHILGLSAGIITNAPTETRSQPIPEQRTVVIVGVNKAKGAKSSVTDLLNEVIRTVDENAIPLKAYSNFRGDLPAPWVETTACAGPLLK